MNSVIGIYGFLSSVWKTRASAEAPEGVQALPESPSASTSVARSVPPNVLELESRPEVLEPEQHEDGDCGEPDEKPGEHLVRKGGAGV